MNESGYTITVKPLDLRLYVKKVLDGEIKVNEVFMHQCACINTGELPTSLLTSEHVRPKITVVEAD